MKRSDKSVENKDIFYYHFGPDKVFDIEGEHKAFVNEQKKKRENAK
jgi:hypothetical protein